MFAKWDDILAIREVPETARGQCPSGGLPYATAVYHYARALALAAKAEGAAQRGLKGEAQRLKGLAETSMALLRVRALMACYAFSQPYQGPETLARLHAAFPDAPEATHKLSVSCLQEAEGRIPDEEPTVPGPPPGSLILSLGSMYHSQILGTMALPCSLDLC